MKRIFREDVDQELLLGIDHEKEHKNTFQWLKQYVSLNKRFPTLEDFAESIALDHLKEVPDYYSQLESKIKE